MQESVRRIIEAEESRMGKMSNILGMGLSGNNVFLSRLWNYLSLIHSEQFFIHFR